MMVAACFLIAIKAPEVAASWPALSKAFERTLRSVCAQTCRDYRVLVVCNRLPDIRFSSERVTVIERNFPSPGSDYSQKIEDKKKKIVTALIHLADRPPEYVMVVDADDCVHRDLVAFASAQSGKAGWYFKSGFEYNEQSKMIRRHVNNFYRLCGTSFMIRYDHLRFQTDFEPTAELGANDRFITGHPFVKSDLAERGVAIEPLPFPGAVYIRDRESVTYQESLLEKMRRNPREILRSVKLNTVGLKNLRPLSEGLREQFGLYPLPRLMSRKRLNEPAKNNRPAGPSANRQR